MKVTFVMESGFSLSGGCRVIATHAKLLQQRGHDVTVIARTNRQLNLRKQVQSILRGEGLLPSRRQPSHFDYLGVPYKQTKRSRPIRDADLPDADVVIATWWETAHWIARLSPAKGAKAYLVQHHEVFDYLPQEQVAATYRLPLHQIVVSSWLQDLMRDRYGSSVSLVPNSVDLKQFHAPRRCKQSIPTIGMIYSRTPWKGVDLMLQAFSLAAREIPQLRLSVFGCTQPTAALPLPASATFTYQPAQDELRHHYARCDAWLFGSRSEGFGLPILEAMACRTPVIGTPAGAAPDLLGDGAGLLVPHDNPEAMAQAIVKICRMSDSEWQALSSAAYRRAIAYTWDDAADRFEAVLYQIVQTAQKQTVQDQTAQDQTAQDQQVQKQTLQNPKMQNQAMQQMRQHDCSQVLLRSISS